jgi:hypothetical protein
MLGPPPYQEASIQGEYCKRGKHSSATITYLSLTSPSKQLKYIIDPAKICSHQLEYSKIW